MNYSTVEKLESRLKADALIIPFVKGDKNAELIGSIGKMEEVIRHPTETGDFKGNLGEIAVLYLDKEKERRAILLGLGEQKKLSVEMIRRAYGSVAKECRSKRLATLNIVLPLIESISTEDSVRGIVEGIASVNYTFDQLRGTGLKPEDEAFYIEKIQFVGASSKLAAIADHYQSIADGSYISRDLANGNADDVNPQYLSELAKEFSEEFKTIKTTIFDKKRLEKEGMGLLLAVGRGANVDPALIIMEYRGNPKSKDLTVVVGKGVTYDTGGLNLKPTGYMETMKSDMSGAAACFGIIYSVASMKLKKNVTVVIPTTENSIGSHSYKPGDVYSGYAGITVEIGNTDAEGRLILADALAYVCDKIKPSRIIDFATLTGAVDIALGSEAAGIMGNDQSLIDELITAGNVTHERLWQLPLFDEYRDQLKSDIADIKNVGGRSGGSITAAKFLQEFIKDVPWAHCDIASTAFLSKEKNKYLPMHATGVGVRLIHQFLADHKE